MNDPRKTETLDLRVRFRFSRLIDPELFLVLSNLTEALVGKQTKTLGMYLNEQ